MTNKDYVILCIGHKEKLIRKEYLDRSLQYAIVRGYADPKKLPKISDWWQIDGEPKPKPIKLTKAKVAKLKEFHDYLKSYGWRKQ